MRKLTKISM